LRLFFVCFLSLLGYDSISIQHIIARVRGFSGPSHQVELRYTISRVCLLFRSHSSGTDQLPAVGHYHREYESPSERVTHEFVWLTRMMLTLFLPIRNRPKRKHYEKGGFLSNVIKCWEYSTCVGLAEDVDSREHASSRTLVGESRNRASGLG
jgi:hypothetical protein